MFLKSGNKRIYAPPHILVFDFEGEEVMVGSNMAIGGDEDEEDARYATSY